jgi:hypothetical protein
MKVVIMPDRTHNPFDEIYRVSRLRENLTSGSEGEGLETGLRSTLNGHAGGNPGHSQGYSYGLPRQSFTRQNKLAELVDFFNLNALSSPIMVRIHFDLLLSVLASFLYRRLAQDLPRFEHHLAPDIFRRFIDMPGKVRFDGHDFEIRIRKHAHTPILLGLKKLQQPIAVPWLEGRSLRVIFTA